MTKWRVESVGCTVINHFAQADRFSLVGARFERKGMRAGVVCNCNENPRSRSMSKFAPKNDTKERFVVPFEEHRLHTTEGKSATSNST